MDPSRHDYGSATPHRLELYLPWQGRQPANSFLKTLMRFRETLALLAAVEHVEHAAWKYLLRRGCRVSLGNDGSPFFEMEVPVRHFLEIDLRWFEESPDEVKLRQDLLELFGTS